MKTYKVKSSAIRAAKTALKKEGVSSPEIGVHFEVREAEFAEGMFIWHAIGNRTEPVADKNEPMPLVQSHYQPVAPLKNAPVIQREPSVAKAKVSSVTKPTKLVWEIADDMRKANPDARRKDIIQACVDAGIAYNTARTQFQHYFKACKGEY